MTDRPIRVQLSRQRGWRMPPNCVKVARPTRWGNPFKTATAIEMGYARDETSARRFVVECFKEWLEGGDRWWTGPQGDAARKVMLDGMPFLRGVSLACFCPTGEPCHGDVLLDLANR